MITSQAAPLQLLQVMQLHSITFITVSTYSGVFIGNGKNHKNFGGFPILTQIINSSN